MKKILFLFIFVAMTQTFFAQDITGNWMGTLEVMGSKLRIGFNITKTDTIYTAKMDSPDQGATGLPTNRTTFIHDTLTIDAGGMGIVYSALLEGDSLIGTFEQSGMRIPLILKRGVRDTPKRPQEPLPPFPYKSEEVTFINKSADVELSGTLSLPDSEEVFPAVILIAGSGPNDRDENIVGHKPFLVIADHLTRNGIAVLRYDKRGVEKSGGRYETATARHFADDVAAAVDFLRSRKEIDNNNIGLVGHSEGGVIAPMVASEDNEIKFIVLLAGMGVKGVDLMIAQNETLFGARNKDFENKERVMEMVRKTFDELLEWEGTEADRVALQDILGQMWEQLPIMTKLSLKKEVFVRNQFNAMATPWFRYFIALDPAEYLQKVKCPVLAVNGEKDVQVSAVDDLAAIKHALDKGRNYRYRIKAYPNLNHLFQESETGMPDEYAKIEQTFSPQVLGDITDWMKKQIGVAKFQ